MLKKGNRRAIKYWGMRTVKDIVKLNRPIKCYNKEQGVVYFNPTIIKLEWDREPSEDKHDLWFPYWQTIDGKEKYGQFAPMMGQSSFLELMKKAINANFINDRILRELKRSINYKLGIYSTNT